MTCPVAAGGASAEAAAMCPFAAHLDSRVQTEAAGGMPADQQHEQDDKGPAMCPYGFSSAAGPRLSHLHCPICRALLFDCHKATQCGHKYCKDCLGRFKDCPLCGADVPGAEPDTETQSLVDTFLAAHSSNPQFVAERLGLGSLLDDSPASLYLALGLASYAGGNCPAAIARLQHCKEALLQQQQQQQPQRGDDASSAAAASVGGDTAAERALAVRLGAVAGSQGDCWRRMGDGRRAAEAYRESAVYLAPHAQADVEVAHALSISLNKLGDLHYIQQDVAAALDLYRQALQLRRRAAAQVMAAGPSSSSQTRELSDGEGAAASATALQLDVAAALIKVADADAALGRAAEGRASFAEAQQLLDALHKDHDKLSPAAAAKLQNMQRILSDEQQQSAGSV